MDSQVTTQMSTSRDAVIITIPRIAPARPSSSTAMLKSLLNNLDVSNKLLDINIDFFNNYAQRYGTEEFHKTDLYLYTNHIHLTDQEQQNYNQYLDQWIDKALEYNPKWILISVFTWQCQKFARDFLKRLRPRTSAKIAIGGQGMIIDENSSFNERPTFALEMLDAKVIDYYLQGEAEKALPYLLKGDTSFPGVNNEQYAPRSPMNEVPHMDFSDCVLKDYHTGYATGELPVETSRGCVRSCEFCDWPVYANGFRGKDGEQLFQEVLAYHKQYGVKNFYTYDSLMNGNVKDFRTFNQRLVEYYESNGLPDRYIRYSGMFIVRKPNQFTNDDFELIARGGADTLLIGVESGSDRIRKEMKKGFNNADLDFTVKACSKNGIRLYFLMMVGWPTETVEDFEQTLDLVRKYQRYVADGTIVGINFGTSLTIGAGTPLYKNQEKFKLQGIDGKPAHDVFWMHKENTELTYKERVRRRIVAQELAMDLGYTFWKGDDQLSFIMQKYEDILNENRNISKA